MNEIDEIKLMENEAALDQAIKDMHTCLADSMALRSRLDTEINRIQEAIGKLIGMKTMFSIVKKETV